MPLKPYSPRHKKTDIQFVDDPFSRRPELATGVGRCLTAWSRVELTLARTFVQMVSQNHETGASLWASFRSDKSKVDAFLSLCAATLDAEYQRYVRACLAMMSSYAKTRNKLSHWYWLYSDSIADGLILIDPINLVRLQGIHEDAKKRSTNIDYEKYPFLEKSFYYYTVKDAEIDFRDFTKMEDTMILLLEFIESSGTPEYAEAKSKIDRADYLTEFLS